MQLVARNVIGTYRNSARSGCTVTPHVHRAVPAPRENRAESLRDHTRPAATLKREELPSAAEDDLSLTSDSDAICSRECVRRALARVITYHHIRYTACSDWNFTDIKL